MIKGATRTQYKYETQSQKSHSVQYHLPLLPNFNSTSDLRKSRKSPVTACRSETSSGLDAVTVVPATLLADATETNAIGNSLTPGRLRR
jgi:hypothetical protein